MVHNHSEYPSSEKATFSQFLHHKRSSKSHPRAESVSSVASSLARSQSTGRNPRMLDIRNAYTSRSLAADQSDVQSVSSQASLLSGWSDLGSVSTSFLSGVSGTTGRHPPCPPTIQEDDNDLEVMSLYSSAPSSLQTQLSSWRPLTGEKRKFSSIAEAISDSDEEADPGGGAAKRPRTPLALPEPGPGARAEPPQQPLSCGVAAGPAAGAGRPRPRRAVQLCPRLYWIQELPMLRGQGPNINDIMTLGHHVEETNV